MQNYQQFETMKKIYLQLNAHSIRRMWLLSVVTLAAIATSAWGLNCPDCKRDVKEFTEKVAFLD